MTAIETLSRGINDALFRQKLAEPVHFSNLKYMDVPARYRYHLENPIEETAGMRIGTAVHQLVLGGEPYQAWHSRRGGKDWEAFKAAHAGEVILNAQEDATARLCAQAVLQNKDAVALLAGSRKETPVNWRYMGRDCSSRVDFHDFPSAYLGELKVTMIADPKRFWRHMVGQLWHAQLAFYRMALGQPNMTAYVIAVEHKPPFPVTVFEVDEKDLQHGEALCHGWMERLKQCEGDNHWPGYAERIVKLAPPEWSVDISDDGEEGEE